MKISNSFLLEEFVPQAIFKQFGASSRWFINPIVIQLAEFYKTFFLDYYKKQNGSVKDVLIVVNDWHRGKQRQFRGYRPRTYTEGGENSQHRLGNAFDCDIIQVLDNGQRKECDYKEIHQAILANEQLFIDKGLSAIEDVSIASTWLHSDCRWLENDSKILIVKPL